MSLRWESVGRREPDAIAVAFDGEPLDASDPAHIPLPPYDEDALHFVSAEVRFSERLTTRLDAGFGGRYGEALTTALTPVPVVPGGAGPPEPGEPSPFVRDGVPLKVHAVETGDARVVVVRDPTAQPFLDHLAGAVPEGRARLGGFTAVSFVSPRAAPLGRRVVAPDGFLHSPRHPAGDEPLLGLLLRQRPLSYPVHLASAVALAGMEAHATQGRRAVLLLLGEEPEDASPYAPGEVRRYLQRLRVPLHVWSLVGDGTSDEPRAEGASLWGETRYAGDVRSWADAVAELRRDLSSQRVVWLEGRHPPQAVELAGGGHGLRLTSTLDRAPDPYGSVAHLGAGSEVRFVSPLSAPVARVASDRVYFSRAGPYLESTSAPEAVVGTLPGGSPGPSFPEGITGDLLRLAHRIATPTPRRLADAVAVAGMELHGAGRRRAVVLAVEEARPDESLFGVPTVRSYLCDLQVPLVLWSVAEARPKPDADSGPGWGAPEWLGTPSWPFRGLENLAAAVGGLRRRLEAQRIVYLVGRHLPRSIALGPRATGIRLAGRTEACGGGPP